ncbi:hypothetical protein ABIE24_001564 [Mycetocola sp. 2940]
MCRGAVAVGPTVFDGPAVGKGAPEPRRSLAVRATDSREENTRDRYAEELDLSGYVADVDTHSWYYRSPTYHQALRDLAALAPPPAQRATSRQDDPREGAP